MKKFIVLLFISLVLAVACGDRPNDYTVVEGAMLGTSLRIVADVTVSPQILYAEAMRLDRELKSEMSIFDSLSLLSRINRAETDSLSEGIIYNIRVSDSISRLSHGAYDITVKPLVTAWGFAGHDPEKSPNVDSLLEFVGYQKISISNGRLVREDQRTQIDLNSIAKGYTVDKLGEVVRSLGGENYIVDIGGEIVCQGVNPSGIGWRVGIESPFDGNMSSGDFIEKRIMIPSESEFRGMATSGNYRRFYLDSLGRKIAHTIDPKTGRSKVSTLLSATVVAPTCALADGYGTMFMALGSDRAIEVAESLSDAEVYFIFGEEDGSYSEYISDGMKRFIME